MKKKKIKRYYAKNIKGEKKLISLVDDPAIVKKGLYFNNEEVHELKFLMMEDKMMVVGPTMIPDIDLMKNINGELSSVVFTKEEIKEFILEWGNQPGGKFNFMHGNKMVNALIVNSVILEDEKDVEWIKNKWDYEVPVGTHWIEMKIEDKEFWEKEVKGKKIHSFSIESMFDLSEYEIVEMEFSKEKEMLDIEKIFNDLIMEVFSSKNVVK